jgi:hypothetical protein
MRTADRWRRHVPGAAFRATAVWLVCSCGFSVHALAASSTELEQHTVPHKHRTRVEAPPPERTASGETVADRERRLRRECRGKPDAGACQGYTR